MSSKPRSLAWGAGGEGNHEPHRGRALTFGFGGSHLQWVKQGGGVYPNSTPERGRNCHEPQRTRPWPSTKGGGQRTIEKEVIYCSKEREKRNVNEGGLGSLSRYTSRGTPSTSRGGFHVIGAGRESGKRGPYRKNYRARILSRKEIHLPEGEGLLRLRRKRKRGKPISVTKVRGGKRGTSVSVREEGSGRSAAIIKLGKKSTTPTMSKKGNRVRSITTSGPF